MSVAEKKTAKKGKLLEAAFELFTLKGINPTAIDEVVKRAGVAKGTFYLYFKDKWDLLEQIVIMKCRETVGEVLKSMADEFESDELPTEEKIIIFLDRMMDRLVENRNLAVLILSDMAAFRKLWSRNDEKSEVYLKLLSLFTQGEIDEEEGRKRMYMLFVAAASVCCVSILYSTPYTPDEIRPQIHLLVKSILK